MSDAFFSSKREDETRVGRIALVMQAETLAARDPDNTQWLIDIAMSCAKLGKHTEVPKNERRTYLQRGLDILKTLQDKGRLLHNQDMTKGFEEALQALSEERSEH
ncbi:MAG: hypothetical protein IPN98_04755 [Propionivibrio sp.]|nr:hypothetical protein [Propionivibrio sp.]